MDSNFRNNLYCLKSYQIFCLFYYYEINTINIEKNRKLIIFCINKILI